MPTPKAATPPAADLPPLPEQPREPEQPGRVFGLTGAAVRLAEQEYHYARFTAAGIRSLQAYLDSPENRLLPAPAGPDPTMGELVAEAVLADYGDATARYLRFCHRVLADGDGITAATIAAALPEELAAVVDGLFTQAGFHLLGRLLKNSLARSLEQLTDVLAGRTEQEVEAMVAELSASLTPSSSVNGSTSSTS